MTNHTPPHDDEAEAAVLGAILLADSWLDTALVDVNLVSDDFYRPRHRTIFSAMVDLQADSQPIDTLTLSAYLSSRGLLDDEIGRDYIETLVGRTPAIGNTRQYAQIVKDNAQLRGLTGAAWEILEDVGNQNGSVRELVDSAQAKLSDVGADHTVNQPVLIGEALAEELVRLEQQEQTGKPITGTPTGFDEFDQLTGGLQPGRLVVLAARPSMGKSVLGAQWALNAAKSGAPVLMVSLEMDQAEVVQRLLAAETKIDGARFRGGSIGKPNWSKIMKAAETLSSLPFWFEYSTDLTVLQLRTMARRIDQLSRKKFKRGLGLVVVDYLQLLTPTDRTRPRPEQVGDMSKNLKALAGELAVPVVAVSQLSRLVDSRKPPRPILSDLRDSGQVEQDADLVAFIYREDYYKREKSKRPGAADLIVAKQRNGGVGDIELGFVSTTPRFLESPLDVPIPAGPTPLDDDDDIDKL